MSTLQPQNDGHKSLIIGIIGAIIILWLMTSCGAVKKDKTEIKEETEIIETQSEKVVTNSETNTKIIDTSTTDEFTIIPIDNTKPIIFNNQKVFNGVLRVVKKKNNIVVDKVEKVAEIKDKAVKIESKASKQVWQKQVGRKNSYWWLLWLLLLIPLYFAYRKFKDKFSIFV